MGYSEPFSFEVTAIEYEFEDQPKLREGFQEDVLYQMYLLETAIQNQPEDDTAVHN